MLLCHPARPPGPQTDDGLAFKPPGSASTCSESVNDASNPCYSRVSRVREARNVLFRTAKTFHPRSEVPQRIDGEHPPVQIEGNHMCEHTTKGKGLGGSHRRIDNVSSQALRLRTSVVTPWNAASALSMRVSMAEGEDPLVVKRPGGGPAAQAHALALLRCGSRVRGPAQNSMPCSPASWPPHGPGS